MNQVSSRHNSFTFSFHNKHAMSSISLRGISFRKNKTEPKNKMPSIGNELQYRDDGWIKLQRHVLDISPNRSWRLIPPLVRAGGGSMAVGPASRNAK